MRVLLDVAAGRRADGSLKERAHGLAPADRALCQEIAYGALRWKLLLDHRLDALLKKGLDSLPLTVRIVLEVAAYQLLFLDRIPPRAAIHQAVEHVREVLPPAQGRGLAGVVNATLRALAASAEKSGSAGSSPGAAARPPARTDPAAARATAGVSPAPPLRRPGDHGGDDVQELAVATSHPAWLVERWLGRFGPERARAILEADNVPPRPHLRAHAGRLTAEELVERLRAEGALAALHPLHPGCVVLESGDPASLSAYREGLFAVQDVSAQIVASLLPTERLSPEGLVVDVCAAPGGKIGALAERPAGRAFLAVDVSASRLARVAANARRQRLPLLSVQADARDLALRLSAELVLADVPCLGTGTFRRRVDARWRKSPDLLPGLLALQRGIVGNAARLLGPGGRLLYATCSLEREENEGVVEWLLDSRPDLRLVDLAARLPAELRTRIGERPESALLVTPDAGECDGAFAALLERLP